MVALVPQNKEPMVSLIIRFSLNICCVKIIDQWWPKAKIMDQWVLK